MNKLIREQARQLRSQGYSMIEIAAQLGVAKSSVSLWTRDIELTEAQKARLFERKVTSPGQLKGAQKNRELGAARRTQFQNEGRAMARLMRPLHLAGCMLYWAEGAKARNVVNFVNSETDMLQFFTRFLRQELHVANDQFVIYVHSHSSDPAEQERVKNYWLEALELPQVCFRKIIFKTGSKIQRSILANGVCSLRVNSSQLVQHIYGAIQEYTGLDKPEWLYMDKASKR